LPNRFFYLYQPYLLAVFLNNLVTFHWKIIFSLKKPDLLIHSSQVLNQGKSTLV
jgi:hypothetical protein